VFSAPVNPSDNYFSIGLYGSTKQFKTLPVGCGFSGAGQIVSVGDDVSKDLIGKKIAINQMPSSPGYIGTFREYTKVRADSVYPFPDELSYDDIANAMGANPITVAGFMTIADRDGHKVFINDAAASALGKMFNKYCNKHGHTLINIVRKQKQVDMLTELGAKIVLNSSGKYTYIHQI
jgi:NADPH:quinone reductase-like Zn-dependent oxidoreductase